MTTKYYLDLDGLKALIQKIAANDKAEKDARIAQTGMNGNQYSAGSDTQGKTDYLAQASSLQDADRKLNDAISDVSAIASATSFKIVPAASTDEGYSADTYAGQYKLVTGDGNNISGSSLINIPKDQFLKNVEYFANSAAATAANVTVPSGTTFPTLYFEWQLDGADADSVADTTWVPVADLAVTTTLDETSGENYIEVNGGEVSDGVKAYTVGHTAALDNALSAGLTTVSADGTGTADTNKYIKVSATTTADQSTGTAGAYKVETVGLDSAIANAKTALTTKARGTETTSDGDDFIVVTKSTSGADTYTVATQKIKDTIKTAVDAEKDRAQAAEGELATVLGATGAEGSRAWTPTTNYGGSSASAQANMEALDTQVKANADAIDGLTAADVDYVNTTSGLTATNVQAAIDELDGRLDDIDTLTNPLEDYDAIDIAVDETNHKTHASVNIGDGLKKTTTSGQLKKIEANVANGLEIDSTSKAIQVKAADNTISVTSNGVATSLKVAKKSQANTGYAATYQLVDGQGTPITGSADIDIVKDQFLKSVEYCPARKEGDAASLDPTDGYPALRFEWYVNEDGSDQNDQSIGVNYVSVAALAATGAFGAVNTTTGAIANPTTNGFATVKAVTEVVNDVRQALDAEEASANFDKSNNTISSGHVGVKVTEQDGLITGVTVIEKDIVDYAAGDGIAFTAGAGTNAGKTVISTDPDGTTLENSNNKIAAKTTAMTFSNGAASATTGTSLVTGATVAGVINDAIGSLDSSASASNVAAGTDTTPTADFTVLTKVNQVDGKVQEVAAGANGSKSVLLKKVAATGAATDVTIADAGNKITATNVEGALQELATNIAGIEDGLKSPSVDWVNDAFDAAVANPTTPNWPSATNPDQYVHSNG